jgi:fatty-acyl-CoA synthase
MLDEIIVKFPDNEAVVCVDRDYRLTYREFGKIVDDLAKGLMSMDVKKGEKVAIWSTNIPYWVALQFATAKIGAILITVNTHYKKFEFSYQIEQSETKNLFVIDGFRDTDYISTLYELVPEMKIQQRGYLKSERFPTKTCLFFRFLSYDRQREDTKVQVGGSCKGNAR